MKSIGCSIFLAWITLFVQGQSLPTEIIAKVNCPIMDGVYIDFFQFQDKKPIEFYRIASEGELVNYNDVSSTLAQKFISYFDAQGKMKKQKTTEIWGYCFSCNVYVNIGGLFLLVPKLETLSRIPEKVPEKWYTDQVEFPANTNEPSDEFYQAIDNIELLVDFRSGKIFRFDPENLAESIVSDSALHKEYTSLSTRKQKKRKLEYLNSFNQRNPLNLH